MGWLIPVLAAALFFILSQSGAAGKSAAYDEPIHLLAGMRILQEGDHEFNHEHPPLMKALAALPVLASGASTPLDPWTYENEYDEWPLSHNWMYHGNDGDRLLRLGRAPIAMSGVLLCLGVAWVARRLTSGDRPGGGMRGQGDRITHGMLAAAAAVLLFAVEPNLLAHGSMITTDMGMSLFFFATVVAFWLYLTTRARGWLVVCGLLWGFGLLAKFSSVLTGPVLLVMGVMAIFLGPGRRPGIRPKLARGAHVPGEEAEPDDPGLKERLSVILAAPMPWDRSGKPGKLRNPGGNAPVRLLISLAFAALLAVLVLNAGYGFDGSLSSLRSMDLESKTFQAWAEGSLGAIPIPTPAPFVMGFDHAEAGGQRWWSYLMGEHSMTGWKHYYLVALLVKTSLPLMLLALGGFILAPGAGLASRRDLILLALPPLVLLFAFTLSGNLKNIGLRYVLPVYPFLCLLGGLGVVALGCRFRKAGHIAAALLLVWAVGAEIVIYPDHLAYFNEIAGGPEGGRWWLLDSNVDWGQDLKGLAAWMKEEQVDRIYLDYFGRSCPDAYEIRTVKDFRGGYLAVSATHLAGVYRKDKGRYDFLKDVVPVAVIGHSILVYDVERPPGWKGHRGDTPH
jgi:hypothetical protein